MNWTVVTTIVLGLAVLLVLDRLLVAAERRGWIRWRHRKPSSTSVGTAFLSVQALLEPDRIHVVEERARQEADIVLAEDDDPLDRGPTRGRGPAPAGDSGESPGHGRPGPPRRNS